MNADLAARHARQLARLEPRRQGHVLRFFERLDPEQRSSLLTQVESVDLELLERLAAEMKADRSIAGLTRLIEAEKARLGYGTRETS